MKWKARKLRSYGRRSKRWKRTTLVRFLENEVALNPNYADRAKEVLMVAKEIENGASIEVALDWCQCKDDFVRRMIFFFQLGAWTTQKRYQDGN